MEQISAQKYVSVIFSAGKFGSWFYPFNHRFFTYQQAEKPQPNLGPGQHHSGPDFDIFKTLILSHFHNKTTVTTIRIWITLKKETMEWRLSLYSCTGTCWKAEHLLGRQASLAPKKTVKAIGAVSVPPALPCDTGKTLSNTFNAHLVL